MELSVNIHFELINICVVLMFAEFIGRSIHMKYKMETGFYRKHNFMPTYTVNKRAKWPCRSPDSWINEMKGRKK
jgi:hypothetical protein